MRLSSLPSSSLSSCPCRAVSVGVTLLLTPCRSHLLPFTTGWCYFPTYLLYPPLLPPSPFTHTSKHNLWLFFFFVVVTSFILLHLRPITEQRDLRHRAVAAGARTSSVTQRGGIMGGIYRAAGNQWLTGLNGEQWLRQTGDLAVTLSGVCLCALWTTLLYHLL